MYKWPVYSVLSTAQPQSTFMDLITGLVLTQILALCSLDPFNSDMPLQKPPLLMFRPKNLITEGSLLHACLSLFSNRPHFHCEDMCSSEITLFFIFVFVLFILFFNFTILYWFCHISTWICHRYTCVPHPRPPPSSLPVPYLWVVPVHQPQASSIVHRTLTGKRCCSRWL